MPPEDIDDLFREQLAGHATPPGEALWARLQADARAPAPDERLHRLFQQGLNAHATPPARTLWERLEDEHLRPRQRRAAAWWPLALAAAVALLLVAGGAGLWLGFPVGNSSRKTVAVQARSNGKPTATRRPTVQQPPAALPGNSSPLAPAAGRAGRPTELAAAPAAPRPGAVSNKELQKTVILQATRSAALASTAPKARMAASRQAARYLKGTSRQPDAATAPSLLVAQSAARSAATPARLPAADEQPKAPATAPVVAAASKPAPAAEIVSASAAAAVVGPDELITVDVRNGAAPVARPARSIRSALAAAQAPDAPRRLGGRLLQQAGHLVRGERVSLAEVTGLPENVTLRATVGGRSVTKSIQL